MELGEGGFFWVLSCGILIDLWLVEVENSGDNVVLGVLGSPGTCAVFAY